MHTLPFRQEGKRWPHSSQGDTLGESQAALLQSSHFSCGKPSFFNGAPTPAGLDVTPSASPLHARERVEPLAAPRRASLLLCRRKLKEAWVPARWGPGAPCGARASRGHLPLMEGRPRSRRRDSRAPWTSLPLADLTGRSKTF